MRRQKGHGKQREDENDSECDAERKQPTLPQKLRERSGNVNLHQFVL